MSALDALVATYLATRRALGFVLEGHELLLGDFCRAVERAGEDHITQRRALLWAAESDSSVVAAHRLIAVRVFARYAQAFDPAHEVPATTLLRLPNRRPTPYLYSEDEVLALVEAARGLRPAVWGITVGTVIGLLWASGLRVGEALRLRPGDVSFDDQVLTVWHSKFDKSREVVLSASSVEALAAYDALRRQTFGETIRFFAARRGGVVHLCMLEASFAPLVDKLGVARAPGRRRPRLADLRHSFATRTLLGWHRDSLDVEAMLPLLSTYLGHVGPKATYWYLSAAPELMQLVANRIEGLAVSS